MEPIRAAEQAEGAVEEGRPHQRRDLRTTEVVGSRERKRVLAEGVSEQSRSTRAFMKWADSSESAQFDAVGARQKPQDDHEHDQRGASSDATGR